jgi:flavin-dependent dehydrogenase
MSRSAGPDAEVVIIGAGPAGCAAAIRLKRSGHDVLVIERDTLVAAPDMTSGELLSPVTQHELREVGVAVEGDWVFDRVHRVRNVFPDLSWTMHDFPPGFSYVHVDRGGLNAAMRARLVEAGGRIVCEQTVTNIELRPDAAVVRTRDGAEYRSRVLIDASGRNAPSLNALKLKRPEPEFRQIGVALFFAEFEGTPEHCWNRHLYGEHGAMVSGSRIHDGMYRYILEADLDDKQQQGMKPVEFYEHVAATYDPWISARCATTNRVGEPWAMAPLGYRASEVTRDRLLLVGDAAGYLSPFTGQGVEFALRSARLAATTVDAALHTGDLHAAAFVPYVDGRATEVAAQVENLRRMLRFVRDRDTLIRASKDDALLAQLIPFPATDRGHLDA